MIGPNDPARDRKRWALTGRQAQRPYIAPVPGQEFSAAFQERDPEKERASWNRGAQVLWLD